MINCKICIESFRLFEAMYREIIFENKQDVCTMVGSWNNENCDKLTWKILQITIERLLCSIWVDIACIYYGTINSIFTQMQTVQQNVRKSISMFYICTCFIVYHIIYIHCSILTARSNHYSTDRNPSYSCKRKVNKYKHWVGSSRMDCLCNGCRQSQ